MGPAADWPYVMRLEHLGIIAFLLIAPVAYGQPATAASTQPATTQAAKGPMEAATELAGFFTAHAVWSVSDGETLIPLVAYETADGKQQMNRLVTDRVEEGGTAAKSGWRRIPIGLPAQSWSRRIHHAEERQNGCTNRYGPGLHARRGRSHDGHSVSTGKRCNRIRCSSPEVPRLQRHRTRLAKGGRSVLGRYRQSTKGDEVWTSI